MGFHFAQSTSKNKTVASTVEVDAVHSKPCPASNTSIVVTVAQIWRVSEK
jgi:hypothetical protein